jgi:hypothetical protein
LQSQAHRARPAAERCIPKLEAVGSWERGLPPLRRASVFASRRRDRAEAGGEGGKAPLRCNGGQAASA